MMSILLLVSEGLSAENGVAWMLTLKPASSPIAVIRSAIAPWMVFVFTSRKVKGTRVGVERTLYVVCAWAKAHEAQARHASARALQSERNEGCMVMVFS